MPATLDDLNNPDTRREVLLERLRVSGRLVAAELAAEFAVSGGTVRRDLLALEREGHLRRVRGGALPPSAPVRPYRERSESGGPQIGRIARRARSLVKPGMCLLLDGGTTVVACARALPAELSLTIVSPSPAVAVTAHANGHEVILVGGRLAEFGGMAVGAEAERQIERCSADLCLLGACSVDRHHGVGADDLDEAGLKRALIASAARTAVVSDATKLGQRSRHRVAMLTDIDVLVTDAPPGTLAELEESGLEVLHA